MHIQNPTKIHRSYSRSDFGTMTHSEPQKWRNHLGGGKGGGGEQECLPQHAFHYQLQQ